MLTKEQKLAIARMNRALKALGKAHIQICGMNSDLLWATDEACMRHEDGNYDPVANANEFNDEEDAGKFNNTKCYNDSGGW